MNYKRIYDQIIERAPKEKPKGIYSERHHIVPLCMGGSDDDENQVYLTPEEHYVAHQLLVKIHPESPGVVWAARAMARNKFGRSNKLYGWLKRKWVVRMKKIRYTKVTLQCQHCDSAFTTFAGVKETSKFCSHKCYWASKRAPNVTKLCAICGTSMSQRPWQPRVFCSKACHRVGVSRQKSKATS